MELEELKVLITAQTKGLRTELNSVKKQIGTLNTSVNNSTSKIKSSFSSIGKVVAGAFAVKKIVDFGKSCLDLGSDLTEVQNVVDVTFKTMNTQVNKFAKDAIAQFGLSETVAKKYAGTLGSMAEAFGFSESEAYEMSTTLTGLAGDVASFYNLSSDEAYTKLKSVFTGETESLKDLGVVMTQSALDQYALANGYGKTTAKMTEQEKVALRYKFVQDQLANAQGDFSRTSDSWANQVRVLSLRFDSLKASIGQGLIYALTPVIKALNTLMSKLNQAAQVFQDFMAKVTGNSSSSSNGSTSAIADNISNASNGAEELSSGLDGVADSANKAAKQVKGLSSIDEINSLGSDDSSDTSGATGSALGNTSSDIDNTTNSANKLSTALDPIIDKAKELASLFKGGFDEGLGNVNLDGIKEAAKGIKNSLEDIFTDSKVTGAFEKYIDSFALNLGKVAGSIASVGITIGTNLLGGLNKYLDQNKGFIKDRIVSILDVKTDINNIIGDLSVSLADIFSVFGGDTAQQITADIIECFANGILGAEELLEKFGRDILNIIATPIIENKDIIKNAINETLVPIEEVTGTIAQFVTDKMVEINSMYDEHIKPLMDSLASGLSDVVSNIIDKYNQYLKPVIDDAAALFKQLVEDHIGPMFSKLIELVGKIADCIKVLWDNVLQPVVKWIIDNLVPKFSYAFSTVKDVVYTAISIISDVLGGLFTILGGIIDFITGVFSGNWEKAWEGVKEIFKGIFDALGGIIKGALNVVISVINAIINKINKALTISVPDWGILPDSIQGKTWSINIPNIPMLAQGGYVKANNPQLAMIGDNTHEGEIVAPESKIAEAVAKGFSQVMSSINSSNQRGDITLVVQLGKTEFGRFVIDSINNVTKLSGECELIL